MSKTQAFFLDLAHRAVASYKSTGLGLLVWLALQIIGYAQSYPNKYVQIVAAAVLLPFVTYKDKMLKNGTITFIAPLTAFLLFFSFGARAQEVPEGINVSDAIYIYHPIASAGWLIVGGDVKAATAREVIHPSYQDGVGNYTIKQEYNTVPNGGEVLAIGPGAPLQAGTPTARTNEAAAVTGTQPTTTDTPAPVAAPEPVPTTPAIGGCFTVNVCISPAVAVSVTAINLSAKKVEAAFQAGAGLQLTYGQGWKQIGIGGYMNLDPGFNHAFAAGMLSFLGGYARVGLSKGFIGDDQSTRLLFSLGVL